LAVSGSLIGYHILFPEDSRKIDITARLAGRLRIPGCSSCPLQNSVVLSRSIGSVGEFLEMQWLQRLRPASRHGRPNSSNASKRAASSSCRRNGQSSFVCKKFGFVRSVTGKSPASIDFASGLFHLR